MHRVQALVECCYNAVQALLYSAIVYTMVGFDHSFGTQSPARRPRRWQSHAAPRPMRLHAHRCKHTLAC